MPFWIGVTNCEMNLVPRKTAIIVRQVPFCKKVVFVKVLSGFQSFFEKSCKINEILFSR